MKIYVNTLGMYDYLGTGIWSNYIHNYYYTIKQLNKCKHNDISDIYY